MGIPIISKLIKAFVGPGGIIDAINVEFDPANATGILAGATDSQTALLRFDRTGIGAEITEFTGNFSATAANIDTWFGGRQLVRLRCTDSEIPLGTTGTVTFDLPGTSALNTAFDTLVTNGLPEQLRFIIEYTGAAKDRLQIRPRTAPSPQITGTSSILVNTGVSVQLEITRTNSTISNFIFQDIGGIGSGGQADVTNALRFQNPAQVVWDASENGALPTLGVSYGYAYQVVNAPADGNGRFGEVMSTGDWVVWEGLAFSSWAAEPHQWFVIPAHQVRRITALQGAFLTNVQQSAESSRNGVARGANYADTAGEIRMKIYNTPADYTPADLNTTGQIDQFTQASDQTGRLAIRLQGTLSSLQSVLPTLYVYIVDGTNFFRVFNLATDFTHQGDFSGESDYLSNDNILYTANNILRIFTGTLIPRYFLNNFDVREQDLSAALQAKVNRTDGGGNIDEARLTALESKMSGLFPLTPDVNKLISFSDIYDTANNVERVDILPGYSLISDYRSDSDRYESTGVVYDNSGTDVVTYSGLSDNLHRAFGFKVSAPSDKVLMWLVDGATRIPYVDITSAGNIRINHYRTETTQGTPVSNQIHFLTRTSGDATVTLATDSKSTYTITNYPASSTNRSRSMQLGIEVLVNGVDTGGEHLQNIDVPNENIAQARQTFVAHVFLGPTHGNRTVNATIGYEFRVSGSDLLVDFTLVAADSDISVQFRDVVTYISYTPASSTNRVDDFVSFRADGGTYTFTGEASFIISLQPHTFDQATNVVGAVVSGGTTTLLNDLLSPQPSHGFASVEIPDDIEFITILPDHYFIHNDLGSLLSRRGTKWAYGIALLNTVTEQQITQPIDFTQGIVLIDTVTGDRTTITVANGQIVMST